MKRAFLAATLAGCTLHEPHVTGSSCTANSQCSSSNICFLGECRAPASNLSVVKTDVRPPSDSSFGARKVEVDLRLSAFNNFDVSPAVTVPGTVVQDPGTAIAGATVALTEHAPLIPDRADLVAAVTDTTGAFRVLHVSPGVWDVLVTAPSGSMLPPYRPAALDTSTLPPSFDVALPQALVSLQGLLSANGTAPLPGAAVTAVNADMTPISAAAVSQADGTFTLSLLPGAAASPLVQVGPPLSVPGTAALTPGPPDPLPSYDPVQVASPLVLPLPDAITVTGTVVDLGNNPVSSAIVYARSTMTGWTLARSVPVSSDGHASFTLTLRAGSYLIEAAPSTDPAAPALSAQLPISVAAATILPPIQCPPKVRRWGAVFDPYGRPAKNVQVIATRLSDRVVSTRTAYTVPTDSSGVYHVVADPGTWRFELVPPTDSGLPRTIVRVYIDGTDLSEDQLPTISIPRPLNAVGIVRGVSGTTQTPIAGASVSFYSLDSTGRSVFLGSSLTDTSGRYNAVLPDVADPSAGP